MKTISLAALVGPTLGSVCPPKYPFQSTQIELHGDNPPYCYKTEEYANGAPNTGCQDWCCVDDTCESVCTQQSCGDLPNNSNDPCPPEYPWRSQYAAHGPNPPYCYKTSAYANGKPAKSLQDWCCIPDIPGCGSSSGKHQICSYPPPAYDDDEQCQPSECVDWTCDNWCKCFKKYPDEMYEIFEGLNPTPSFQDIRDQCATDNDDCDCDPSYGGKDVLPEGTSIGCYHWNWGKKDSQGQHMFQDWKQDWYSGRWGWHNNDNKIKSYFGITDQPDKLLGQNIWTAVGWSYEMCLKEAIWQGAYYFGMGIDASMASSMNNIAHSNCFIFTNDAITPNPFSEEEGNQFSNGRCCDNRNNGKCIGGVDAFVLYATGLGASVNQPDHVVDVWEEICPTGNCGRVGEI